MAKNDTESSVPKLFYFHADANAIGGTITRPFNAFVPSQTSVSLPIVGGFLQRERKGRKWKDVVSCTYESTRVTGSKQDPEKDGPWTTEVSASVENLNILGVIEADQVVAQLSIAHPHNGGEPTISILGSQFENLRVGGVKVKPVIHYNLFSEHDGTTQNPSKKYPTTPWPKQDSLWTKVLDQKTRAIQRYADTFESERLPNWILHHFHELGLDLDKTAKELTEDLSKNQSLRQKNDRDYIVCSLVDHLDGLPDNFPGIVCGNGVYLPGYGRFYFGEVIVQQGTYRVSMIRAQLGSGIAGQMAVGVASSNGKPGGP